MLIFSLALEDFLFIAGGGAKITDLTYSFGWLNLMIQPIRMFLCFGEFLLDLMEATIFGHVAKERGEIFQTPH